MSDQNIFWAPFKSVAGTVGTPFSPSGVVKAVRRYRAVGMEKYIGEVLDAVQAALKSGENALVAVIAPYGWGKSELLDELSYILEDFEVERTVLAPGKVSLIDKLRRRKDRRRPFLLLIDEADEISRMLELQKLGVLNDGKFREMLLDIGREIRAILEPRSHADILGDVNMATDVVLIVAVTPQLYYSILKNMLPDIFDVARGRIYKEIKLDERMPLWLFHEMVKNRLGAYGEGGLFTLSDIAAVYHLASKIERVPSPRLLVKLAYKLYHYKKEGKGLLDLVKEPEIARMVKRGVEDSLLVNVLPGLPILTVPDKYQSYFHRVKLVKLPFSDREALRVLNEARLRHGLPPIPTRDVRDVSFAPFDFYTVLDSGEVYLYVAFPEPIPELQHYLDGDAYIPKKDLLMSIFYEDDKRDVVEHIVREVNSRFESADIHELVEGLLGISGARSILPNGKATVQNSHDIRLGLITLYVLNEKDLEVSASAISAIIDRGSIGETPIDAAIILLLSNVLLSSTLEERIAPLLEKRWKLVYREPAHVFVKVLYYGADKAERLRDSIVFNELRKVYGDENPYSESSQHMWELANSVAAHIESARKALYQYTLALRRGRDGKGAVLRRIVSAWLQGKCSDQLPLWCAGERLSLSTVEESFYEYLLTVDAPVTQKTLEREIRRLYPVHLWRDFKEDDLVHIMVLRGLLVPCDARSYKPFPYAGSCIKKFLESMIEETHSLSNISVEAETHLGTIKLTYRIPLDVDKAPITIPDPKTLSSMVLSLLEKRDTLAKIHEEKKRELSTLAKNIAELAAKVKELERFDRLTYIRDLLQAHIGRGEYEQALTLLRNEAMIAEKVVEVLHLFSSYKEDVDIDEEALYEDLRAILSLPQPLSRIDTYMSDFRRIAEELKMERIAHFESLKREVEEVETMARWARRRLGVEAKPDKKTLVKILSEKARNIGVDVHLMIAIAKLGYNTGIDIARISTELGLPRDIIVEQLEKLVSKGIIEKKYVA